MNKQQKTIINEWINTTNYVYNKTLSYIKTNKINSPNFQSLRNKFITNKTKKNNLIYKSIEYDIKELNKKIKTNQDDKTIIEEQIKDLKSILKKEKKTMLSEKNENVDDWELNTPKDIRAGAIDEICTAYKSCYTNYRKGNIKFFNITFRKKSSKNKCITIPKVLIKLEDKKIKIAPSYLKENAFFKINNKTNKKLKKINFVINHDSKLVKKDNKFFILIPYEIKKIKNHKYNNICGIDPGVRTFMTLYSDHSVSEYKHNIDLIRKLNKKIDLLTQKRIKTKRRTLRKVENKKLNLINELHWKTVDHIIKNNDILFYGNINSHNIVKNKHNKILNRDINDLKFYQFKHKLFYKANINNKLIFKVDESYTSKTCSCCGCINDVGASKVYTCSNCKIIIDRDINGAKNILMKGYITVK